MKRFIKGTVEDSTKYSDMDNLPTHTHSLHSSENKRKLC